jgi:hypothetical protein
MLIVRNLQWGRMVKDFCALRPAALPSVYFAHHKMVKLTSTCAFFTIQPLRKKQVLLSQASASMLTSSQLPVRLLTSTTRTVNAELRIQPHQSGATACFIIE